MSAQTNPATTISCEPQELTKPLRVAVICDFPEENWPSMDLVGSMLFEFLRDNDGVTARCVRPEMAFGGADPGKPARLFGRFVEYPRLLRRIASEFDLFHIVDHSYAHLVHELPTGRAIVTCHDLDAFASILAPERERRSFAFRLMTRRILSGLQAAAHVTCDTAATRNAILQYRLVPEQRLTVVHNGVHPLLSVTPDHASDEELARKLGRKPGLYPELLHVGSTIARKRIDVLLHIFAEIRKHQPHVRLIRVGAPFTLKQKALAASLGVAEHIDSLDHLNTPLLAACYRRASVLMQPSESEGFGLPVIEALACGTPVIASNIPPLREVGGDAATYCSVADIDAWTIAALNVLLADERERGARRARALRQASRFTWANYADSMSHIYRQVLRV